MSDEMKTEFAAIYRKQEQLRFNMQNLASQLDQMKSQLAETARLLNAAKSVIYQADVILKQPASKISSEFHADALENISQSFRHRNIRYSISPDLGGARIWTVFLNDEVVDVGTSIRTNRKRPFQNAVAEACAAIDEMQGAEQEVAVADPLITSG